MSSGSTFSSVLLCIHFEVLCFFMKQNNKWHKQLNRSLLQVSTYIVRFFLHCENRPRKIFIHIVNTLLELQIRSECLLWLFSNDSLQTLFFNPSPRQAQESITEKLRARLLSVARAARAPLTCLCSLLIRSLVWAPKGEEEDVKAGVFHPARFHCHAHKRAAMLASPCVYLFPVGVAHLHSTPAFCVLVWNYLVWDGRESLLFFPSVIYLWVIMIIKNKSQEEAWTCWKSQANE